MFEWHYCSKLPVRPIVGEQGWNYPKQRKNSDGKIISDKTDWPSSREILAEWKRSQKIFSKLTDGITSERY